MAMVYYSDGVGGSTGDSLVSLSPMMATSVLYVSSVSGDNAYDGTQRSKPKATLAGAYAIAANGTIIVLLSNHSEVISSVVTVSLKNVVIVGEGSSSGSPTAIIGCGANVAITFSGDDCQLRNIKFTTSTSGHANARVNVTGKRFIAKGCKFECGANDSGAAMTLASGATYPTIGDCTFISTSSTASSLPGYGLLVSSAADGLFMDGTIFSDGTYGFGSYAMNGSGTLPNISAENISLLLGAEMNIGSAYGYVHVGTSTGGGRVI